MDKHRSTIKIMYNFRKNLPNATTFYFIYYNFKLIGIILSTQNLKEYESQSNKITSFYSIFSKLLLFDSSFNIISYSYQWICIMIFIFLISFILFFFITFKTLSRVYNIQKNSNERLTKFLDKNPLIKTLIKVFTNLILGISFFSQYIQEYLFFGIIYSFIKKDFERNDSITKDKYLTDFFLNQEIINSKYIMIINIISYIICYLFDFMILFVNDTRELTGPHGIEAWDEGREITILRWGIASGYITSEEAMELIEPVLKRIRQNYISFEDYICHYIK